MLQSLVGKLLAIVGSFVQADDKCDTKFLENGDVVIGSERAVSICYVEGARERDKLSWNDPVQISVFNALEMLILLHIKLGVIVPSELDCILHALKRVQNGMLVGTSAHCRVTEGHKLVVVGSKSSPGFISRSVAADDHKATHQEGSVSLLGKINTGVMIDLVVGVLTVVHELLQLFTE